MVKRMMTIFVVLGIAFGAASCGKKAEPAAPQGSQYPRAYPTE